MNRLHHLHDFVKALLAFNLLLNIIDLFPMLIKALISERQRRSFGNVIIKGANIGGNFAAFKFVKTRFFFFGQIFAGTNEVVNALCDLRPFEKHTRFSVLQSTV